MFFKERSESVQSLLDEGYELLTESHPNYERLLAVRIGVDKNSTNARIQSCNWRGRPSFGCNSTGGQCRILFLLDQVLTKLVWSV